MVNHMAAMPMPKVVSKEIIYIWKYFLWQGANKEKKWSLVACEKLCLPKNVGCLSYRDLKILSS